MTHIQLENVSFGYTNEKILDNINLDIQDGQLISISGENGSGKSTLLKLILGQLKADKGTIKLLEKDINSITSFKEIGYVPQIQNFNNITFPITAREFVVLNLYEDFGLFKIPKKHHKEKAEKILIEMGMQEYIHTPFNQLSGGFKQRAMIARAMINNPKILILDEPTSGVDQKSKVSFLNLIEKMNKEKSITIVIVTHETSLVQEYLKIDKIYKMQEGNLNNVTI